MFERLIQEARFRRLMLAVWDVLCWQLAALALLVVRFDFALAESLWESVLVYSVTGGLAQLAIGWITKAYRGRYSIGSFEEAMHLARTVLILWLALSLIFASPAVPTPAAIVLSAPFGALLLMAAGRFALRALVQLALGQSDEAERVIIYGAGNAGVQISRMMTTDPDSPYEVVGFVDDDPRKRNLHIGNTKVLGRGADLIGLADEWRADAVLLAVANAPKSLIRRVTNEVETSGRRMLVLPPLKEGCWTLRTSCCATSAIARHSIRYSAITAPPWSSMRRR